MRWQEAGLRPIHLQGAGVEPPRSPDFGFCPKSLGRMTQVLPTLPREICFKGWGQGRGENRFISP